MSFSENIGQPDFKKISVKDNIIVKMDDNPLTFTTRGETFNECTVTETFYRCSVIKGSEGWGKIRLNRFSLDMMMEVWAPNSKSGQNDKLLFEGSCRTAKQQL